MAWGLTALAVVAFLLLANVLVETGALQCPGITIVSRNSWGARPPRVEVAMKDPRAEHVFIHHTTGPQCKHKTSCIRLVRSQQKHHMDTNRWPDISYNFLVGGDGLVYEGRGFGREGAHTHGYNRVGIAIAFVGDYNRAKPSQRMLLAAKRLISCGVRQGMIRKGYSLHGHRDANCTTCPGNVLYDIIKTWANFKGKLGRFLCLGGSSVSDLPKHQ
ncbi:peptidoglycan-recognition protein SC2 [Dermacentor silvarum]|uniref:peptidoglycan-recognition protein SC2 n=1 Tax=Dermacentor silvarum TaxID=543639 RepID=UPI00189B2287|nr:peptidoglycan-recognition protein SC2 [Dermacentor silvarum]